MSTIRIICGEAYMVKAAETFTVRAHDMGNGHLEVSGVRDSVMTELDWTPAMVRDHLEMLDALKDDEKYQLECAAKRLKIAANRCKTRVRRLCKAMGANTLLTLTYRFNEVDLGRVKLDVKEFNRRMLRVLPEFRFVALFEKQTRGAYHVHMATAGIPASFIKKNANGLPVKIKSFDLIRTIWRSVTKERQGNIDIARRKRHSMSSAAAIASYISKYITKSFSEGEKGSNRFAAYGDFTMPPVINLGRVSSALEVVEVCYSLLGDRVIFNQYYSPFGDWFFLHAEPGHRVTRNDSLAVSCVA